MAVRQQVAAAPAELLDLAAAVQAVINSGETRPVDSDLRLDIQKRYYANGQPYYTGQLRERGRNGAYRGYIGKGEIETVYKSRLNEYHGR